MCHDGDDGGYVGDVDGTVFVDVGVTRRKSAGHGGGHDVDDGGYVGHVDNAVAVHVAIIDIDVEGDGYLEVGKVVVVGVDDEVGVVLSFLTHVV